VKKPDPDSDLQRKGPCGMTDKQREVVGLLRQGLTYSEVATFLGIPRNTVASRAFAASKKEAQT
jgi:DNA-directed RNA polymerase specialized sigma24 family protein